MMLKFKTAWALFNEEDKKVLIQYLLTYTVPRLQIETEKNTKNPPAPQIPCKTHVD